MYFDNDIYLRVFDIYRNEVVTKKLNIVMESVLALQVDLNFGLDFIKLQSIIVRTNLLRKMQLYGGKRCHKYSNCDICNSGHCIDYMTHDSMKKLWKKDYEKNIAILKEAIKATDGYIVTYEGKPIDARFNYTCGGGTENSENVINNKVSYLRRVLCDYCKDSPHWMKIKELEITEIEKKLGVLFVKGKTIKDSSIMEGYIDEINRDETGRVANLKIGGKYFDGLEVARQLGLESTRFTVAPSTIKFLVRGKGDGLGLCQWGAKEMLSRGFSIEEVLRYYYTGVDLIKINKPSKEKPLQSKIIVLDAGHGGEDSEDAYGFNGIREKDIALNMVKSLKSILEDLGVKIYLTRDKDEFVSLKQRVNFSNQIRPHFFISIHLNSIKNKSVKGSEAYHYRDDEESKKLGKIVLKKLNEELNVTNRGVKSADFYMLREIGVSALHLEAGYLSNEEETIKFTKQDYINKYVKVIAESLVEYFLY
ncbi:N-acetylmuramoyl-L-alanine amidase [Clostridiaceae bacterium M8S5]|nr:N-acetylmuramoyl-L-alanine amidase [Clostridiaceae bacterium M8S5]